MKKNKWLLISLALNLSLVLLLGFVFVSTRDNGPEQDVVGYEEDPLPEPDVVRNEEEPEASGTDDDRQEGDPFEIVAADFAPGDGRIIASLEILNQTEDRIWVTCFYVVADKGGRDAWAGDNKPYILDPGSNDFSDGILSSPLGGPPELTGADLVADFDNLHFGLQRCEIDYGAVVEPEPVFIGQATSAAAPLASGETERVISEIRNRNVDDIRLGEARFRLVDGIYVHTDIVIHNDTAKPVDAFCEYWAYTQQSGGGSETNYSLKPGRNEFSQPFGGASYGPGEDVFSEYDFVVRCHLGQSPHGRPSS